MSVIGLRVGPFEVAREATVPEPGAWFRAVRTGMTRRQPGHALVRILPADATAEARQQLQREFENLRTLDDPRVPAPIAFYEGIGALAIAFVDGTPLDKLVDDRRTNVVPLTPATLLDVGLEVADALQHAHHKGRWHGHLWPGKVVLGSDGHLWVWGFGSGPVSEPPAAWAAPERARGQVVGAAADQWALGASLAALITGAAPWRTADPGAEARRGDPAFLAPVETQWPALGRLLRRMVDPHPENRFPSLQPVRQELLALARKAGGASERHKLGGLLADRHGLRTAEATFIPDEEEPAPPEPDAPATFASAPQEDPPSMPGNSPRSALVSPPPARLTPAPAPPRAATAPRRAALPEESMPIVRPVIDEELPVARVGRSATPGPPPVRAFIAPKLLGDDRTEASDDRAPTEMADDRAATEMIDDRQATEMIDDRQATELFAGHVDERETTEMVEVSDFHNALVERLEEPVEDPISESRESLVRFDDIAPAGLGRLVASATMPPPYPPEDPVPGPPAAPAVDGDEDASDQSTVQYDADRLMTVLADLDRLPEVAPRAMPPRPAESLPRELSEERRPTAVPVEESDDRVDEPAIPPLIPPIPPLATAPSLRPVALAPVGDPPSIGTDGGFFRATDPGSSPGPGTSPDQIVAEPLPPPLPEPEPARIVQIAPWLAIVMLVVLAAFTVWHFAS